ncbi:MAG: hypothetical protein Ct9H300mP15_20730 [Gemmatimonadota bacterium]|nr:MAG: hypothetical protein Ct9H300mP15_20730 [Gemmatimonadota bacterium]
MTERMGKRKGNIPGLPERTYVSRVAPSAHAQGRAYPTFDGHRNGDFAPYVFVTEDFGQSWSAIATGLPHGWSVNVIAEHHRSPDLLFLETSLVFTSRLTVAKTGRASRAICRLCPLMT